METLIQRSLFKKTTFEIKDHSLNIKSQGIFNSIEYDISFEDFSDKIIYETKVEDISKLSIVCFFIFLIISIINNASDMIGLAIFTLIIALVLLYITRRKTATIVLFDNRVIVFNQSKPNLAVVKQFIENLQTKIKVYLKV